MEDKYKALVNWLNELLKQLCDAGFTEKQGNAILSVIASVLEWERNGHEIK